MYDKPIKCKSLRKKSLLPPIKLPKYIEGEVAEHGYEPGTDAELSNTEDGFTKHLERSILQSRIVMKV